MCTLLVWEKGIPLQLSKQISKLFFQMSAQVKWERRPFWSGQAQIYLLNYLLHMGVMLTIIKVFIILFVLCLWEQGTPKQCSKQIRKLSFKLSVQIYSLLSKLTGKERSFLEGKRRLSPRALGCRKRWKSISFCGIWNNPTPPLFFIRPPYK